MKLGRKKNQNTISSPPADPRIAALIEMTLEGTLDWRGNVRDGFESSKITFDPEPGGEVTFQIGAYADCGSRLTCNYVDVGLCATPELIDAIHVRRKEREAKYTARVKKIVAGLLGEGPK